MRSPTVDASSDCGLPGTVNGTTVLLTGDGFDPAPLSLTAMTVNAYCCAVLQLAGRDDQLGAGRLADRGVGAGGDGGDRVLLDVWPCPLAAGQRHGDRAVGLRLGGDARRRSGTSEVGTTGLLVRFGPAPLALTACTVNRYVWPLVRPVTSSERWLAPTS